jgi:hypothetical protein
MDKSYYPEVINNIQKVKKSKLTKIEYDYCIKQLDTLKKKPTTEQLQYVIAELLTDLKDTDKVKKAAVNLGFDGEIDMHQVLVNEITNEVPIDVVHGIKAPSTKHPIDNFLGISTKEDLQLLLNPHAKNAKTYIVLDRKFQASNSDNKKSFTWDLSSKSATSENAIVTRNSIQDICKIKVFPFKFPNTQKALTFSSRISMAIEELQPQSYRSPPNNRYFHFLFQIIKNTADPTQPYEIKDVGFNETEFVFYQPVRSLDTITLTFGNPFLQLELDPDRLRATLAPSGVQTLLTFTQPHFSINGDLVILTEITSDQPEADFTEIQLLQDKFGWPIVNTPTTQQILIDVDISTVIGVLSSSLVFFDSKRFIIPMEISFIRAD